MNGNLNVKWVTILQVNLNDDMEHVLYKEQFVISLYHPIYFTLMNYSMTNIPEKHHSQIKQSHGKLPAEELTSMKTTPSSKSKYNSRNVLVKQLQHIS